MTEEIRANVLIVDDRPENLLVLESSLADLGQNLVHATSGSEALRFLLTQDFALIILDVQMPGLNGFDLAELIRERERTQQTPIIFISAVNINEQYIFKGYSLGAVDYLTKPFEPEILKSKVRFFTELFRRNQEIKRQSILLEQANAELDTLNMELEARVEQRTKQLEDTNHELENQIESRKKSEARLATEHAITRTLADAEDLATAAPHILQAFCEHMSAEICCLWLLNKKRTHLSCIRLETSREAGEISDFVNLSRQKDFPIGVGLPGQVWQKNELVWLPNTVRGEKHPRAEMAAASGLDSAIGFPIKIGREFYGMIEFFTRQPLLADRYLTNMLEAIGSEIGQFIQRKQAETERENLLKREKHLREQAEAASRLKDEFLATVSHELRTPLNAILGWSGILKSGRLDEEKMKAALETIGRNAKSQAQLIDDLLDTSRLITNNLRLNLSPTPVIPVIEAALDVVRPMAQEKGISLSTFFNSKVESIICDSQRLQQMVWNLLTNSVKFTPSGGSIEVATEQTEDRIKITVTDSGQGIPPKFLPFVFDLFRQEDSSNTRKHNGLGLGLAIVRHLAELHGGTITAHSQGINKGATFTISLPCSPVSIPVPEKIPEQPHQNGKSRMPDHQLKGLRILVVDDDADTCEMLTFVLNQWGAEAQAKMSASEALDLLNIWKPDLLLSDISMPNQDGYYLINQIRKLKPEEGAKIPAIAITALARAEDTEKALSAGFQLHLAKPIDVQKLVEAISHLTQKI